MNAFKLFQHLPNRFLFHAGQRGNGDILPLVMTHNVVYTGLCTKEQGILFLNKIIEALADDLIVKLPAQLVFHLFAECTEFRLAETFHQYDGVLGNIFVDKPAILGLFVVRNGICHPRFGIHALRNAGKEAFHSGLHGIGVDVAEDNDRLQVGTVKIVIIGAHFVGSEVVQDFRSTDNVVGGVLAVVVEISVELALHPLRKVHSLTAFFEDDFALDFHFVGAQLQEARPIVQDKQAGIYQPAVRRGNAVDVIHGFIRTRIGIQILNAPAFQESGYAFREMLRSMESHVLQHVGQSVLMFLFHQGTHVLHQIEVGFPCGCTRGTDVISQSVIQPPVTERRFRGCRHAEDADGQKCQKEYSHRSFSFSRIIFCNCTFTASSGMPAQTIKAWLRLCFALAESPVFCWFSANNINRRARSWAVMSNVSARSNH